MNRFIAPIAVVIALTLAGAATAAPAKFSAETFFKELSLRGN